MHQGHGMRGPRQGVLRHGGNFALSPSDTEYTAAALRRCRLTVQVSTKLNRSHVVTGSTALILPCLGRTEVDQQAGGDQFQTVEDSMGVINPTRGNLKPASTHLRSEPAIVAGLAKAVLGPKFPIDWDAYVGDYDLIRDKIEAVVPGFPAFNDRIRTGTFYLPNGPRDERKFDTPSGKAVFIPHRLSRVTLRPGQYLMTTMRSHDQFYSSIYGLDDRYRGIYNGRRVIFLNEEDIKEAGLMQGELVDITSHFEGEERHRRTPSWSPLSDPPAAAPPPTFPKPMSWSPAAAWPNKATALPQNPSSSPSSPRPIRRCSRCPVPSSRSFAGQAQRRPIGAAQHFRLSAARD